MKVILLKDVKNLGKAGDLVDAKSGYARNFLLPRGLAEEATKGNIRQWKEERKVQEAKEESDREEALQIKERIEASVVNMKVKGGEGGRLFGSVTTTDIAEALKTQYGIDIDRKKIQLNDNIKEAGVTNVEVRVYPEITANLQVNLIIE